MQNSIFPATTSPSSSADSYRRYNTATLQTAMKTIFHDLLPSYGYALRPSQTELAEHMLTALGNQSISLSEAAVGVGKTHAYLLASILAKRGRMNDHRLRGHHPQSYASSLHMPIVIATSGIALQRAILTDYIPELSRILLRHGFIRSPITCVMRKGKEHYLCERNLAALLPSAQGPHRALLHRLQQQRQIVDMEQVEALTPYLKRKLGVAGHCNGHCPRHGHCRYHLHMEYVQSNEHDFQVCNHNYFLADVRRRSQGMSPLIPHYQAVILDEAHKFLSAARQMYGVSLSQATIPQIAADIEQFTYRKGESGATVAALAGKISDQSSRLFARQSRAIPTAVEMGETGESRRFHTVLDDNSTRHIKNIAALACELHDTLRCRKVTDHYRDRQAQALYHLTQLRTDATAMRHPTGQVCWLEREAGTVSLHTLPQELPSLLYDDLWSMGVPILLTSGTLSAGGSFAHIKQGLGLDRVKHLMETGKPSPFRYDRNALLYISRNVPFPDSADATYLQAVADEVEKLVTASHGHAAVLFTSYRAMDRVYALLRQRLQGYPLIRLERGSAHAIDRFRRSGNGILFASGAMWEGIDLPGDILSMLIIVKLPFAVPDPISAHEQTLYAHMGECKDKVVVPDMILKLKQGVGCLLRSETDTGVVALLDSRVREHAPYSASVLQALPPCSVTSAIADVSAFLRSKKQASFFL